jgi:hypothetical protein
MTEKDSPLRPVIPEIRSQIESTIHNSEIVSITSRYLTDSKPSDIQALLVDPNTRPVIISHLKDISDHSYRSLISSLTEGPKKIHSIGGLQIAVDALAEEMIRQKSPIYTEKNYKTATDNDYRNDELEYRGKRKKSGDTRWLACDPNNPDHRRDTASILNQTASRQGEVKAFLEEVEKIANLPEGAIIKTSQRVKGIDSLFNKIAKFRENSWGVDATIADAVDLLGARMVISDLKNLEKVMQAVEKYLQQHQEFQVLRKENKFIVNHQTADPYRAIHYIVALPSIENQFHSFELQLSTLPSLIAGDLAHDAIYKPHLLNLPGEFQQIVRDYNWESVARELKEYLKTDKVITAELSKEQQIENAISSLDYNCFYDLVLNQINLRDPLDGQTIDYFKRFHQKEITKLEVFRESNEKAIIELAQAAHNGYFEKNSRSFYNITSDQLGNSLSLEAIDFLTQTGQDKYKNRYENFDGRHNKLSVDDLELHKLTDQQLEVFFTASYKDLSIKGTNIWSLIDKIKALRGNDKDTIQKRQHLFVMNLNHASFQTLLGMTDENNSNKINNYEARELFKKYLIDSQIKALATTSLLTEIGGIDPQGNYRDLSVEAIPGLGYTKREMLTHMFFITVNRPTSETASMSFEDFANSPLTTWAKDNDKVVDQAILSKLVTQQLSAINQEIVQEENPVLIARYEKARYELVGKYMSIMVSDRNLSEQITKFISIREKEEVKTLLGEKDQTTKLINRVKDPIYFTSFINYLITQTGIPSVFN